MHATISLLLVLFAQAQPLPAADPQTKARAQALLTEGTTLYERGDLTGALEKFEAAYRFYPSPKLQFNIGQANRDLGRPVEALTAFEAFLASAPDAAPELLAEARQSVTDLAARLGRLKIECRTPAAVVTLDGKSLGTTPIDSTIWVVPGRHQVTLRGRAYTPIIADVTVAAGEIKEVRRTLLLTDANSAATIAATTPALATSESAPKPVHDRDNLWSRQGWHFWAAAGGAVAFSAGAIAAGLSASARYSDLQGSCGQTSAGCTEGQIDSVKSRATVANVLWFLAGASAVGAGVSFYFNNREAGVALARRF